MITTFYPAWASGGQARVAYEICKRLAEEHEVTVFTTDVYDKNNRIKYKNNPTIIDKIEVYRFKNISNRFAWKRFHTPISLISASRKEIKNFDVVHIHGTRSILHIPIYYYIKKYNIPYILQAHGSVLPIFQKQRLKKIFDLFFGYKILKDVSKVIALTKTEAEQYKKIGVAENKIEIVPNGIDLSEYDNLPEKGEFRRKYKIEDKEKIILYLGRIHRIKGIDLLVKAFAGLIKELDDVRLIIAGPDDGFSSTLKRQIGDLKIGDKILFTGPLYERDKLKAYVDADVYVLPSVYEIFGITVLEACACGTPVIVTDRCGIADVVDGKVGYVVEYDKDQLRDALLKILSDGGLRIRFGEEGRKLARDEFGWDKIVKKIEELYVGCL